MDESLEVERYARVKELFARVRELPLPEQSALLAQECSADGSLRREVEELLTHARAAGDFLEGRAQKLPVASAEVQLTIPGFRLFELLAAGASGVVYRAEQERPRREVAIKVLRLDTLAAGQVARFQREAEILARLAHPGIAQVLGAGVAESAAGSLPWIAMEFVRGRELSRWLAEERPDVRARVTLFVALCEAVQHAHGRGVVHRDLKPSNVLIEDGGQPKVLDFGIARVQADERATSERTRTGLVMGTLAYMAPEQARGEAGAVWPASDVYALGVMLFEALTGELPLELEAADVLEGVRIVCEVEPRRLRALAPELPADLETILLKALDKDPLRRYAGAGALGADLENWLSDRPVLARRPTAVYQARKFVRRNRALSISAAVVILALAFALAQALRGLERTRRDNEARSALADFLGRKYFALASRLGFTDDDRRDAEEVLALLESRLALDPDNRDLRVLLAQALNDIGDLHQGNRAQAEAQACYQRAFELRAGLVRADPQDRESLSHLSRLCAKLGETARDQGDLSGRDRWFAEALTRDEALVARFPDDLELREDLGWSLERVADVAARRGDTASAQRLRQRRYLDAEELVRREPDNWKYVYNLSHVHFFLREGEQAQEHMAECLRLARRGLELRPGARDALLWMAQVERAARAASPEGAEGREHALAALELSYELVSKDPYRWELLNLLRMAGSEALGQTIHAHQDADARSILRGVREHVSLCLVATGLTGCARLVLAEMDLFEAQLLDQNGAREEARRLADGALGVVLACLLEESSSETELELSRDLLSTRAWVTTPQDGGLVTRLIEPVVASGLRARAAWLCQTLAEERRLPETSLAELAALKSEHGL